jgi:hypothetical protein
MASETTSEIESLLQAQQWKRYSKLKQEIDSWRPFWESLTFKHRQAFRDMLFKILEYADMIESSGREYTTESLLISLLLNQQERIDRLEDQVRALKQR